MRFYCIHPVKRLLLLNRSDLSTLCSWCKRVTQSMIDTLSTRQIKVHLQSSTCVCNKERDSLLWRVGRVSVCGGLVDEGECCGNDTVQLEVARLTLMHQKWLLRERGTRSDGRGQKESSFPLGLL